MKKLSIIILSYNTKNLILECVKSVISQYKKELSSNEFELIVVDNASIDGSVQAMETVNEVKLIKNKANLGFSKGCNVGAKDALGKYILFLNSDTKVTDRGFLNMISFMEKNNSIGVLGGSLLNLDGSVQASCGNFYNLLNLTITLLRGERLGLIRKKPTKIQKVDWVSGASMIVRRDLFRKLKGFDENLFMYMEDMELCFRVKKMSFSTYYFPDVKIVHQELGSSNKGFAIINIYKGILYFYKKHAISQYPLVKIMLLLKALIAILIGILVNNNYLKNTYTGALKLAI